MNKITLKEAKPEQKRTPKAGDLLIFTSGDEGIFMLVVVNGDQWSAVDLENGSFIDTELSLGNMMAEYGLELYKGSVTISTIQ